MYLSGPSVGPFIRAYIFTPAGSDRNGPYATVCGSLKNGCYNTGRIDMGAPKGQVCLQPDPQQFDDYTKLLAYAAAHGESVKEFASVPDITAFCSMSGIPSPGPAIQAPPPIQLIPSPGYINAGVTSSGARILPSGVTTPSAPPTGTTLIMQPTTPTDLGAPIDTGAPQDTGISQAGFWGDSGIALVPLSALAIGLFLLFGRKRK